jgi:hypothetical protein
LAYCLSKDQKNLAGDKIATAVGDGSAATVKIIRDVALKHYGGTAQLINDHRTFAVALPRGEFASAGTTQ